MKAENEFIFDSSFSNTQTEFRFHVHMYGRRYSHRLNKMDPCNWKANDRFLVYQGEEDGEFFIYLSTNNFNESHATKELHDRGYRAFRAAGSIDSINRVIRFEQPHDYELCIQLLRRVTSDDSRLVEHYKGFTIISANGMSLGNLETYWFPE